VTLDSAILLHFLMPLASASPIIALVAMPLAIDAGYSPLVPALVCLIAGDHAALPYTNSGYLTLQVASGGDLFSETQARPYRLLGPLLRRIAVLASVPYWQSLGLL
jgi:hypothetical protein